MLWLVQTAGYGLKVSPNSWLSEIVVSLPGDSRYRRFAC